ncbi:unnamed protein product, partial [Amoebophrya sp. A25]
PLIRASKQLQEQPLRGVFRGRESNEIWRRRWPPIVDRVLEIFRRYFLPAGNSYFAAPLVDLFLYNL